MTPSSTSWRDSANESRQQAARQIGMRFSQSITTPPSKAYLSISGSLRTTPMPSSRNLSTSRSATACLRRSTSSMVSTPCSTSSSMAA
jgi:hypothetical protein